MKIQVQTCVNLGDDKKPRSWSKYAPDSTAYKILNKNVLKDNTPTTKLFNKREKMDNIIELLKKHKDDPLFIEFIKVHLSDKTTWLRIAVEEMNKNVTEGNAQSNPSDEIKIEKEKLANKEISDLEYMKLMMKDLSDQEDRNLPQNEMEDSKPKKVRNRPLFYIKISGLPYKCKKKDIKDFFRPLVPFSIRLPFGKGKKITGFCYVGFRTEKELYKALNKDKLFIGNHRIHIQKYEDKAKKEAEEAEINQRKRNQEKESNEESIGESGSIFIRNLPYIVTEEELTNLFQKFGPIAEVNMPLDKVLRQTKGFATVTFMMPEHAVKAFTELDGSVFCGRMLHLLPAKTEKLENEIAEEGLSFKEKKMKKLKSEAQSSHNWNTLFLGTNAIADVVAANYNTTKDQLLSDGYNKTSAAVRLALGETQLVAETRRFLEKNGVYLDAFNKTSKNRSKTCILVKNLPAGTSKDEIRTLFEKYGQIARFLMPEHGISALIDFIEPFEAKKAFTKLAYSQFKSSPLYLEWAPENVFIKTSTKLSKEILEISENVTSPVCETPTALEDSTSDNMEVKNTINEKEPENDTTIFVKNINFKTDEKALKNHFSNCGELHSVTIAKKKDPKNPGQFLSMGYGFVQFYKKQSANEALKLLQCSDLDGKTLELKRSEKGNTNEVKTSKKTTKDTPQNGTKILVRNVPFQANKNELDEIFRAFGEIKTLRLPKKLSPGVDQHRGFGFVDYYSKADAKMAFEALCQSTHLYGRRLVLEWADQTDENENVNILRKRTAQAYNAKLPGGKKSRKGAVDVETFVEGD